MEAPKCFVCDSVHTADGKWREPGIVDWETAQHVHYSCMLKRIDELNHELEFHPCCKKMGSIAGDKIKADIFTETFAVYDPDNNMKYYFNGMRYCPFCGKGIVVEKNGIVVDISQNK